MARPTLLTDELREELEAALGAGTPVRIAAESVGISRSTLHAWISDGHVERRPRLRLVDADVGPGRDPADEDARIEAALVAAVLKASETDWRAARWLLRNRWPRRWARA